MPDDNDTITNPADTTTADTTTAEGNNDAGTPVTTDGGTADSGAAAAAIQTPSYFVPPLQQPTPTVCWATVATMMMSWHDQMSYTIDGAMSRAGTQYQTMVANDQGLLGRDKPAFLTAVGLRSEYPADYTVEGFASLIAAYGPLWITTDESPNQNFAIHARIVTGMSGDGTMDGTMLQIVDPADGTVHTESYNTFMTKYDRVAMDDMQANAPMRVQVVHY